MSLPFQQSRAVGPVWPVEGYAHTADVATILAGKIGKGPVVAHRGRSFERAVELDMGGREIDGGAAAVEPKICAELSERHRLPILAGDNVTRICCQPIDGPGRYERRRQYNLLHQDLPPARIHLGAFEGERKSHCAGYDESYGATKAALSLIALTGFLLAVAMLMGAL